MAIDQETTPTTTDLNANWPVIENEIPTYRAVSTRAIFAVICGLLAVFSFAHPIFYLFAVLAVILGVTADRSIQRHPEMLTGQTMARVGVLLGLVFGLSIATVTSLQNYLIRREAVKFAATYAESLKASPLAEVYWLGLPPTTRAKVTAQENWTQLQQSSKQDLAMTEMKHAPLKALADRLKSSPEQKISFLKVETQSEDGDMLPVVLAVFEIDGPTVKEHEGRELALAVLKGMIPEGSKAYEWWVEDLRYPYKPSTYVIPDKPVDDGHGHAPGGGDHGPGDGHNH
ncbi:MAG: DUF4190 domain-containing protein [Paludisphaera borealis]|uniref:DUF4190 domain-containing protein n=1 Tax=Paludisphaera borealis TaxID=1387353 RepID=UPI0028509B30|nr:DUF4190 domain-containing protein [Paludisphaera borealis]MDR3621841.1 DUF4190 domain-containing protein [Paludisphaera borealis]